ncbi:MAG: alanine racemase [Candidatus Azotimanducaceae bacterium]|jgi:alanine racemase
MEKIGNSPSVQIHLNNISENFDLAQKLAPNAKVMAVVKADAYGHGALEVCRKLKRANGFAVARVSEGVALRSEGINNEIYVLEGFLNQEELHLCHEFNLIPYVHSEYQLDLLEDDLPIWIKINTGMNRLGFTPKQISKLLSQLKIQNIVGIASHFANADKPQSAGNQSQINNFNQVVAELGLGVELSFANSDCILSMPDQHLDWIRPGVMLYGSSTTTNTDQRLKHGMTLSAPLIAIRELEAGDAIGYGGSWCAKRPCRIAVIGLGYADGYPREMPEGTPVLVQGKRRRLVGRISMDMLFVELEIEDDVKFGERFIFWGEDLSIDEIAEYDGSIAYTLMTGLTHRVRKIY